MTTVQCRLRVLGGFELQVGGRPRQVPWQAQRLLAFLAVGGGGRTRGAVAGTLWSAVPQRRAQANLRNAVWRLRSIDARVLDCDHDAIGLDDGVALDLREARQLAEDLLREGGRGPAGPGIGLLDDDLLPEWDEPWLLIEYERHRQLRMHALERLSLALTAAGDHAAAITAALAAVSAEPLRESSQHALIAAHLAEGNVSEAVRQLASYRRLLRAELGIEPGHALADMVAGALAT